MEYYNISKTSEVVEVIITIVGIIAALICAATTVFGNSDSVIFYFAVMMFAASQFAGGVFDLYKASRFTTKSDNNEINICYQDIAEANIAGVTPSKQQHIKEYMKQCWTCSEEKELWRLRYERHKKLTLKRYAYITIILAVLVCVGVILDII